MKMVICLLLFSACLPIGALAQKSTAAFKQSPEQISRFIQDAYEKRQRITVHAQMLVYERRGSECVQVEKVRRVNGIVLRFSSDKTFTISEYRGFAPFMDDTEGGGFQIQYTICLSKVIAVKKQNQFLRVIRDTGETAGFIGTSAALVPTIPVILILAKAGKVDW